ncbi:glycosyltransferase [Oceanicola sp. S124]|uniref:glycosyltransferase n=1 Tax=Oceanicola sp. S124 TaxID=1042378 RepID=UPI000255814B|nr:glycosyltransferase [Oceanicola sp. S124]
MAAAVSVIVTTRNAQEDLPRLMPVLFEAVQEDLLRELIFADLGSTDETAAIAEATGAELVAAGTDPRAAGAALARGDWLLFLDQRDLPQAGWTRAVADHLPRGGAAVFRLGWACDLMARFGMPRGRALLVPARDFRAGRIGRARLLQARCRRG